MSQPVFELTTHECVELLYSHVVGRVAVYTRVGIRIVPVNYAIVDDAIVWRTNPYSELATYGRDADAAFEVDDIDRDAHQGWSVVAYGRLEVIDDPEEVAHIRGVEDPGPWAAGQRHMYMRIRYRGLTGRRLGYAGDDAMPSTGTPPFEVREGSDG
jgi:nitroimidazol reductase NimA-like FMN-containing flavoprotein (pyridoxamine 5'-phosphate oxidase superfamily)